MQNDRRISTYHYDWINVFSLISYCSGSLGTFDDKHLWLVVFFLLTWHTNTPPPTDTFRALLEAVETATTLQLMQTISGICYSSSNSNSNSSHRVHNQRGSQPVNDLDNIRQTWSWKINVVVFGMLGVLAHVMTTSQKGEDRNIGTMLDECVDVEREVRFWVESGESEESTETGMSGDSGEPGRTWRTQRIQESPRIRDPGDLENPGNLCLAMRVSAGWRNIEACHCGDELTRRSKSTLRKSMAISMTSTPSGNPSGGTIGHELGPRPLTAADRHNEASRQWQRAVRRRVPSGLPCALAQKRGDCRSHSSPCESRSQDARFPRRRGKRLLQILGRRSWPSSWYRPRLLSGADDWSRTWVPWLQADPSWHQGPRSFPASEASCTPCQGSAGSHGWSERGSRHKVRGLGRPPGPGASRALALAEKLARTSPKRPPLWTWRGQKSSSSLLGPLQCVPSWKRACPLGARGSRQRLWKLTSCVCG